jgi:hypothetical protein
MSARAEAPSWRLGQFLVKRSDLPGQFRAFAVAKARLVQPLLQGFALLRGIVATGLGGGNGGGLIGPIDLGIRAARPG